VGLKVKSFFLYPETINLLMNLKEKEYKKEEVKFIRHKLKLWEQMKKEINSFKLFLVLIEYFQVDYQSQELLEILKLNLLL
jgi:hypothetical protein